MCKTKLYAALVEIEIRLRVRKHMYFLTQYCKVAAQHFFKSNQLNFLSLSLPSWVNDEVLMFGRVIS